MDKFSCTDCKHMFDDNGINACKWLRKQKKEPKLDIKKLAEWWNYKYKFEKGAENNCKGFSEQTKQKC